MSRRQLTALAIALLVLLVAALFGLGGKHGGHSDAAVEVGSIESSQGQVESRLPNTLEFKAVKSGQVLHSQELVRTDKASEAVLVFNTGTAVKLNEATKFAAEVDASRPEALMGTVLEGQVAVLQPGSAQKFRLFYQGRELPLGGAALATPAVIAPLQNAKSEGLVISATLPEENPEAPEATASPQAGAGATEPAPADVLTNEDIVRELRSQTGFFQRCYLSFLHRTRAAGSASGSAALTGTVTGTVTVSFKVQANGRVGEANIVRSDFDDNILHRCVSEVVERTRFKPFKGDTVPVLEFPITLQ